MHYRKSRYDPDYETDDPKEASPRHQRAQRIYFVLLLAAGGIILSVGVAGFGIALVLMWSSILLQLTYGIAIGRGFSHFRDEEPRRFWVMIALQCAVFTAVSYFIASRGYL